MRDIDDTDRELLRLLLEDARRPYSELAEAVDLSPPAVSDRVDRLQELGVIERFTLGLDRSRLADDLRLGVTLEVSPGAFDAVDVGEGLPDGRRLPRRHLERHPEAEVIGQPRAVNFEREPLDDAQFLESVNPVAEDRKSVV